MYEDLNISMPEFAGVGREADGGMAPNLSFT